MTDSRTPRYGTVDKEYGMRLATTPPDADGSVWMVNLMKYREVADYTDGRESTISGREAADAAVTPEQMDAYSSAAADTAGAHGVRVDGWFAVEGTILGDGRTWDQVRFNAFPSKAAFMAVVMDPARLQAQKANREPAFADTYTMIVRPAINRLAAGLAQSPDPQR